MKGEENLIPLSERTKAEQREIQKKAGKASGEARREKKQFQKAILAALDAVNEDGNTVLVNIIAAQVKKALNGDTKAFEVLRDTSGEKPTDKIEASVASENKDLMKDYLERVKKGNEI